MKLGLPIFLPPIMNVDGHCDQEGKGLRAEKSNRLKMAGQKYPRVEVLDNSNLPPTSPRRSTFT